MSRYLNRLGSISPLADLSTPPIGHVPGMGTSDLIEGDDGDNTLGGTVNPDTIKGYGGNDFIIASSGEDTVFGGDGNDVVWGGMDFDTINGGAGDDSLKGIEFGVVLTTTGPCDLINGGGGIDNLIVDYAGFVNSTTHQPVSVTMSMATGTGQVAVDGFQGEQFSQMERLTFTGAEGNDTVTGGDFADTIDGRGGNDVLRGAGGDDIIKDSWGTVDANGGSGIDTIALDGTVIGHVFGAMTVNADGGVFLNGGVSVGSVQNFENLTLLLGNGNDNVVGFANGVNVIQGSFGMSGTKTITGGDLNDVLRGADGDDTLFGGAGNDDLSGYVFGNDTLYGGAGNDTMGVSEGDIAYGGADSDLVYAGGGAGSVEGGSGDDFVLAFNNANGLDSYIGGGDYDILRLLYDDGLVVDLTGMTIDVEELQFVDQGAACDFTTVLTSAQLLSFDVIRLGTENREDDQFTIRMADNADLVLPEISQWMRLELNDAGQMVDMRGVGTDWVPWIVGGEGDDEVLAPKFADAWFRAWLEGGNDTFHGSFLDDEVDGGAGKDTIDGSYGNDKLQGGDGNDKLFGGQGNDHVTDILNGGAGADKLKGEVGADTYVYKKAGESTGKAFDTVIGFDFSAADVFDVKDAVTGIDAAVNTGSLSKATFNEDLEAAIGTGQLKVGHAVLFTASAGDFAGDVFLIVDTNGTKGYQANKDLVILLDDAVNIGSLDTADFI